MTKVHYMNISQSNPFIQSIYANKMYMSIYNLKRNSHYWIISPSQKGNMSRLFLVNK
jgi:hypothetical protein